MPIRFSGVISKTGVLHTVEHGEDFPAKNLSFTRDADNEPKQGYSVERMDKIEWVVPIKLKRGDIVHWLIYNEGISMPVNHLGGLCETVVVPYLRDVQKWGSSHRDDKAIKDSMEDEELPINWTERITFLLIGGLVSALIVLALLKG